MKLRQLGSNQAQVEINDNLTVFFSYDTPVACFIRDQGYFRSEKRWSVTTTRHINKWLGEKVAYGRPQEFFDTLLTFSPTNFADRVRAELSGQHNPDLLAALKLIEDCCTPGGVLVADTVKQVCMAARVLAAAGV